MNTVSIKSRGKFGYPEINGPDGQLIPGVTECDISLRAGEVPTARLEILVVAVDVVAHPLLGLDTITEAAKVHGYCLVPIGEPA